MSLNFIGIAQRWIAENGEILALIRFSHMAGSKDFVFFTSSDAFREQIGQLPPKTCVTVFRQRQLPLRGFIDTDLIAKAISLVPEGQEYLIAGLDRIHCGRASWIPHWAGETQAELTADLEDNRGRQVAVGLYPPWLADNENVASAVMPEPNGTVVCGVY